ncbi:MAG: MMPL family transporter [Clostridia bacterium]|nr:MMPL family transporter [Clostridia bacterium]
MSNKGTSITEKVASGIVKGKWIFVGIFAALAIACVCLIPFINVEYDLSTYLAEGSDTSIAMEVLKKEFDDKGMAYVMVKNVKDLDEADQIAEEMMAFEGVSMATYMNASGAASYKNNAVLYTVTLSCYDASELCFETIENLIDHFKNTGREAYFTGQSAYSYFTKIETEENMLKIGIVIAAIVLIMLLFTSKTYFELVVMIIVFAVSIALNIGTNVLFPSISYISNLISLVLQLALSIDYSVILLHHYMEEKAIAADAKKAATTALAKAMPEIMSSSLTTIVGLAALMFMSLKIGVEIGISLAKSIVCSLVAVMFLMPALLVIFSKPLEKSKHRDFVPNITKPARAILKGRKVIVPLFLVIMILSGAGQFFNTYAFNMNGGSKIVTGKDAIYEQGFGTLNSLVVIVPKGDYEKERALAEFITSKEIIDDCTALSKIEIADGVYLTDKFSKDDFITMFGEMAKGTPFESIVSAAAGGIYDGYLAEKFENPTGNEEVALVDLLEYVANDESLSSLLGDYGAMLSQLTSARASLESEKYARMTFNINAGVEDKATFDLIGDLKEEIKDFYPTDFYITGESAVCYDMSLYFPKDNMYVSIFTVIFILIVLLLTFRNFALPVILTAAIEGGIWINFVIPFLAQNATCFIGYLIIMAVQMGATIDYAIVLTNRYLTTRDGFPDRYECMAASENAVFPTIITSGVILTVTGFTLSIASSGVVSDMGTLLGIGTLTSMFVVIFVVPSLLLVCEKVFDKLNFKDIFKKHKKSKTALK